MDATGIYSEYCKPSGDIAITIKNQRVFDSFGKLKANFGILEELLAKLLAGWMAAAWLADGFAVGGGWWLVPAGGLAGHMDPSS